jgi:hypothetical protein
LRFFLAAARNLFYETPTRRKNGRIGIKEFKKRLTSYQNSIYHHIIVIGIVLDTDNTWYNPFVLRETAMDMILISITNR